MAEERFQAFLEHTECLETARFSLRPLVRADAPELFNHFSDPRVTEFTDVDTFRSIDEAENVIAWATSLRAEGKGVRWTIRNKDDQTFLGTCGFNALVYDRAGRGEIAYDLSPKFWGRGVMADVMPAVLAFAESSLGLRRVEAMVTPGNDRSTRLLERHGFACEGLLRQYAFWKGQYWDQFIYAKIISGGEHDPSKPAAQQ